MVTTALVTVKSLADQFLAEVLAALAVTPAGAPESSYVAPGQQVAFDSNCSQAFVVFSRIFPSTNFPAQDGAMMRCQRLAVTYQIGVTRCVFTPDESATLDEIALRGDADAETLYTDAGVLAGSILRVIAAEPIDGMALFGDVTPYGPQGGIAASIGTVTVDLTASGFYTGTC